jgi:hypothetical protein
MRVWIIALLAGCLGAISTALVTAQEMSGEIKKEGAVEYRSPYGFCFSLPDDWRGFSVVQEQWKGYALCSKGSCVVTQGPQITIQNPNGPPRSHEDIPIMAFTLKQWKSLGEFTVSAAPVPPRELGRNQRYVFALPARYNYDFLDGWEEVDSILKAHSLHAPCSK